MSSSPNSSIFDLCKHRDWRRVELECNREPLNAVYNCGDDIASLPLHVACKKQPTSRVVRSLLKAYPQAARIPDANGYLPLHVACLSNASVEVLQTLTDNDPETASLFNTAGESTLAILSRARDTTESYVDFHNPALWQSESTEAQEINYTTSYWQKVQVLLEAIAIHRQSSTLQCVDDLFTLHAAASLSWCPADILHFCLYRFPEQVEMTDDCGQLPLHLVIRRSAYHKSNETLAGKLHIREKSITIPRFLHLYPEAATLMDPLEPSGRYPLHTALLHKHEWFGGVKELYQNNPEATLTRDPVENLYPFQLASFDLDTTFQLLRKAPSALMNAAEILRRNETKTSDAHHVSIPVLPSLSKQTVLHSPPQRTPRQNEKRRKNIDTSLRAALASYVFPAVDDDQLTCHNNNNCDPSRNKTCKNGSTKHEDIFFSIDGVDDDTCNSNPLEVVWEPPHRERRRGQYNMDRIHSIREIAFPQAKFHSSVRRGAKSSVVPIIIIAAGAASDQCPDETPLLVEESEIDGINEHCRDEARHNIEETEHSGSTISSGEEFYSYAEMLRNVPSEQSVDTRQMQNLNIEMLDMHSTCSHTMADESTSSQKETYNKYKCMISGMIQKDRYTHEWSHDVVSRNVRKLYKQPTVELFNI